MDDRATVGSHTLPRHSLQAKTMNTRKEEGGAQVNEGMGKGDNGMGDVAKGSVWHAQGGQSRQSMNNRHQSMHKNLKSQKSRAEIA